MELGARCCSVAGFIDGSDSTELTGSWCLGYPSSKSTWKIVTATLDCISSELRSDSQIEVPHLRLKVSIHNHHVVLSRIGKGQNYQISAICIPFFTDWMASQLGQLEFFSFYPLPKTCSFSLTINDGW